ncbi:hypothetical protein [Rhizobium mongolense]|uniref:Uncharacterized protein n=1 Tax=Rhizobium mongolense TaxID=57676 RepID=A0A7W6RPA6_9HYPH|nr:hypothetical protein [Rhizobium mongolense]MBB4276159.1 hypothetical protein [Rhizobium mongolense]
MLLAMMPVWRICAICIVQRLEQVVDASHADGRDNDARPVKLRHVKAIEEETGVGNVVA